MRCNQYVLGAAFAVSMMAVAIPASASITVDGITMDTTYQVDITRPDGAKYTVYDNKQNLHVVGTDPNSFIDFLCADVWHFDNLGGQNPNQVYTWGVINTDFGGNVLNDDQKGQLNYFEHLMVTPLSSFDWAALQAATWIVEKSTVDFLGQTALHDAAFAYVNDSHRVAGPLNGWINQATGQSGLGGVPEPSTWALMIAGFGAMGAMLRRRRQLALA